MSKHIFLIAGEPSGDRLGAGLMAGLKERKPEIRFSGIGGPAMTRMGINSHFPYDELTVMGIAELLPRIPALLRRIRQASNSVLGSLPDALVTIDSPDFGLRVGLRVKSRSSIPVIHYVCPTFWAWRPGRARKLAKSVDHVFCLFPFEKAPLDAAGIANTFVGHPATEMSAASAEEIADIRQEFGVGAGERIIVILLGSRRSEIRRLGPVFKMATGLFLKQNPGFRAVIAAAGMVAELVAGQVKDWPGQTRIFDPRGLKPAIAEKRKSALFCAADAAMAASGTVSLELAASATPMVAAYDLNWISRRLVSASLTVDTVNLVNLVSDTRCIPEFLGRECRPEPIAAALGRLVSDPNETGAQLAAFEKTLMRLGSGGMDSGSRASSALLKLIDR